MDEASAAEGCEEKEPAGVIGPPIRERLIRFFGEPMVQYVEAAGTGVIVLAVGQPFADVSPVLRRLGAAVDRWPVPPAGLFVLEDRMVILRSTSAMTLAHEFGHAIDCALGGRIYRSTIDPDIRRAFEAARGFVTPYAASGIDEYFAEGLRAYAGANDPRSLWPAVTRDRLREIDARLAQIVDDVFREVETAAVAV